MERRKAPPFRALPTPARLYIPAVVAAAVACVLAGSAVRGTELDIALLALVVGVCAASNLFEVFMPGNYSFQPNLAFFVWAALLLPPWAIAVAAVACFIPGWVANRFPWYKVAFNVANYLLAGLAAHWIARAGAVGSAPQSCPTGAGRPYSPPRRWRSRSSTTC